MHDDDPQNPDHPARAATPSTTHTPAIRADGGVSWIDLTAFQRDCLAAIARRERDGMPCDPNGIAHVLERRYSEVTRARLDPNLRVLEGHGLLEKEPFAAQRYEYPLTDDGRALLVRRVGLVADACGLAVAATEPDGRARGTDGETRPGGTRDEGARPCPDCDAMLVERDPLMGWWLCDDCRLAVDDDGTRIT